MQYKDKMRNAEKSSDIQKAVDTRSINGSLLALSGSKILDLPLIFR